MLHFNFSSLTLIILLISTLEILHSSPSNIITKKFQTISSKQKSNKTPKAASPKVTTPNTLKPKKTLSDWAGSTLGGLIKRPVRKSIFLQSSPAEQASSKIFEAEKRSATELKIPTADGKTLAGTYFERPGAKKTIVLFHGSDGPSSTMVNAKMFYEKAAADANILMVDSRGFGGSQIRKGANFGEKGIFYDTQAALSKARSLLGENYRGPESILAHGFSLGSSNAAIAGKYFETPFVMDRPFASGTQHVSHAVREKLGASPSATLFSDAFANRIFYSGKGIQKTRQKDIQQNLNHQNPQSSTPISLWQPDKPFQTNGLNNLDVTASNGFAITGKLDKTMGMYRDQISGHFGKNHLEVNREHVDKSAIFDTKFDGSPFTRFLQDKGFAIGI